MELVSRSTRLTNSFFLPDAEVRLREWHGIVRQYILVSVIVAFLFALNAQLIPAEKFFSYLPAAIIIVTLGTRLSVRRLPRFLAASRP